MVQKQIAQLFLIQPGRFLLLAALLKALPWLKNVVLIATILAGWIMTDSCFKGVAGSQGFAGYREKEIELGEFRFEPIINFHGQAFELARAQNLWLKSGEQVAVKWNTFEIHWELAQDGVNCLFDGTEDVNQCSVCDLCTANGCTIPHTGAFIIDRYNALLSYESFISEGATPDVVSTLGGGEFERGCPSSSTAPITFSPDTNMLVRMLVPIHDGDVAGETKIHILQPGQRDTTAYQLTKENIDGTDYWKWQVPEDPWLENFSPNLRVTSIRVLKGRCMSDPISGKCIPPAESPTVEPSRILFLPGFAGTVMNYQGGEPLHRCYANTAGTEDGSFINLDTCRQDYGLGTLPTSTKSVTPTFEFLPDNRLTPITWLLEFNTAERGDANLSTPCSINAPFTGCDAPTNEDLIVEFTIQAG